MGEHYNVLLDNAYSGWDIPWEDLSLCSEAERRIVIEGLNNTSAPYPAEKCIHDLFEDQAMELPNSPCITYHEPVSMLWVTLSYGDLYCRCYALYTQLRRLGVGPDTPVPILIDRSIHQIVAIYGVLLAGGCYVPIDPDYPNDRVLHMLNDAKATVVLTTQHLADKIPSEFKGTKIIAETIPPGQIDIPTAALRRRAELNQSPDTNVYIFYTSGTTGLPKGVEVTHRGLVKRAQWLQDFYPLEPSDKMIYKTPFTFGISEWELFWPIPYGAQVVITKEGGQKDPEYLIQVTTVQKVTVCTYVPSMLAMLLEYMVAEGLNYCTDMKHVICCGEALPVETCYKFFECFDPDITRLHNLYGPTEADMTYWECPKLHPGTDHVLSKIPIGKPMLNVKVFILDGKGNPVPAGVPGELHFGGVTTARGYLGLPDLTAEKFVPNPYRQLGDCDRMYKTGDCARWLPDLSTLEFLGRVDHQVKLRGFRIELGEIESVIGACRDVQKVAVIVDGKAAAARLVAYVEPKTIDPKALIKTLKEKVPEYMIPSVIMPLANLPVTNRGKLDRKALPAPPKGGGVAVDDDAAGQKVYPSTHNEKIVESVWKRILNRAEDIDVHTNFLTLGGNSLLAGRVTTLVRKETGSMIPSTAMYQHPTISKIAALCDKHKPDDSGNQGPVINGNKYKRWGGFPSTSPKVIIFHLVGLLVDSFASTAAFLPGFMYLFSIYYSSGKWEALKLTPFVLSMTMFVVCFYTILVKMLFLGKVKPGEYPVWGSFYLKWWLVNNLHKASVKMIAPYVEETVLYNKYMTMMGAVIGDRVSLATGDIFDPDLVTIEDDVAVERKATIIPHSIENGILTLWPIHINQHCRILPVGWVTQGTRLPPGSEVGPLSTTGLSARNIRKGSRLWSGISNWQNFARICLIPVILIMETVAFIPALLFLEWLWEVGLASYPNDSNLKYCLFYVCIPWVEKLVVAETFFLMVAAYKWIFIGRFKPGKHKGHNFSMELRKWFLERLTHHQQYRFATQPWINTELLAIKYRIMGVSMGVKVQTDYIEILEFDLLTVGRDSVFGSNVCVNPTDHHESRRIIMQQGSQVLDHSTLMPGCVVGRGALCGSSTVGSKFYKFPDLSISTGNQQGKPVQLRVLAGDPNEAANLSHLPPAERDMALTALRNHQNNFTWGMFNLFNVLTVMLIAPLPAVADLLTILLWIWMEQFEIFQAEDTYSVAVAWGLTILVTPPAYCVVQILETILFVAFKWVVVGKYKEGNYPFYGPYHRKWVIMMAVKEAIGKLLDDIAGTPFLIWFFKAMGSKMGKDVCMMGYGLEYDLFSCGDYCSVGVKCDVTCHTVENMVIKLAKTTLHDKCTMRAGALVQPGGSVLDGGVVMENSQVLKGGEVGEDQVYAGLPAEPVQRTAPELAGTQPSASPLLFTSRKSDVRPYIYIFLFLVSLWLIPSALSTQRHYADVPDEIKVRLPAGIIRSEPIHDSYNTIIGHSFAGIPYAEPPLGHRRWAPPAPSTTQWSGVRDSRRRPGCVDSTGGSEDCLYLDVDVPMDAVTGGKPLPVVVWFHGGCSSYSRPDGHLGKSIVTAADAVVVTPSYRVGVLGYFHHKELDQGMNFGILDQRMVLQWVQSHIKLFGGDPSRVTLLGQASGVASVAVHLTSLPSYGLFHRAVLQSPPVSAFIGKNFETAASQTKSITGELAKIGSCPGGDLKCLRELRAMSLFSTGSQLFRCRDGKEGCSGAAWMTCGEHPCPYGPIIDGKDLKDHPWRLIESGEHAKVPIIIGYRLDDGLRSMNHQAQPLDSASEQQWREWAESAFWPIPESVISRHYLSESYVDRAANSNRSASWHAALAARTDQLYGCGVRRLADALSRTVPTFVYLCTVPMYLGVHSHLWFTPEKRTSKAPTMFEQAFVSQLQGYVGAFIATGDPGSGDPEATAIEQVAWERYTASSPVTAQLSVPVATTQFPAKDVCKVAWDDHWVGMASCISNL
eukprot:TRINITY_DN11727_c1_g1_i1.p1 TRINITY_DN11727_c1_g1~~TRINITY_DN11727_c1_g1_i1.p1  ORF type:complete len:2221 (+),score=342.23 TRINITY_DN11727_c1_g1_i1:731-6664(+)